MPKTKINKSAFVRSLAPTTPASEVVKAASAKGIKLSEKFVHTIRYNAKKAAAKKHGGALAVGQRGPGRPRKNGPSALSSSRSSGGLEAEIERIIEAKVSAMLKQRLGALFDS